MTDIDHKLLKDSSPISNGHKIEVQEIYLN